jgi:uncharacterized protein YjbJ (UPF0337 family)
MNGDQLKGALQKTGGHIEEAAGALVGDQPLKEAGQEDQIKGEAREAWGNVKEAGNALIDRARVAKADAEIKSERAREFDREHSVEVAGLDQVGKKKDDQSNQKQPSEKSSERQPKSA